MAASIPQQPAAPVIGFNAYGSNTNPSRYGITAEDLRRFQGKEAGEEDFKHFIISDTMYLKYLRTREHQIFFENVNGNTLRATVNTGPFPTRMDTAYVIISINLRIVIPAKPTVKEGDTPPPTLSLYEDVRMSTFKFFKALKRFNIFVGHNRVEITNAMSANYFQNKFAELLFHPISESNLGQEYVLADCIPSFVLSDRYYNDDKDVELNTIAKNMSKHLYKIYKQNDVTQGDAEKTINIPLQFMVPWTLLHPMFNFNTVLPPGTDVQFEFEFLPSKDMVKMFAVSTRGVAGNIKLSTRLRTSRCFIRTETPEMSPEVIMSLKTKRYLFDYITPHFYRTVITKTNLFNNTITNFNLRPPKSPMPIKMDFMLVRSSDVASSPFHVENVASKYLESITFHVNSPFPYNRTVIFDNNKVSSDNFQKDFSLVRSILGGLDNLTYSNYGEQHVRRGAFPPTLLYNPVNPLLTLGPYLEDISDGKIKQFSELQNTYPNTVNLLPSDQLNQNPYPIVRGSLSCTIKFKGSLKDTDLPINLIFFINFYYWNRAELHNGKCLVLPLDDIGVSLHA